MSFTLERRVRRGGQSHPLARGRRVRAPRGACVQPLGVPRLPHAAQRPAPSAPHPRGVGVGVRLRAQGGGKPAGRREGVSPPRREPRSPPGVTISAPPRPPARSLPPAATQRRSQVLGRRDAESAGLRVARTQDRRSPACQLVPNLLPRPLPGGCAARGERKVGWGGRGPAGSPFPPSLLLQRCLAGNRGPPGDGDSPLLGPGLSCAPTHGASALASLSGLPSSCPSPRASRWRAWLPPGRRHPALRPPGTPAPRLPLPTPPTHSLSARSPARVRGSGGPSPRAFSADAGTRYTPGLK